MDLQNLERIALGAEIGKLRLFPALGPGSGRPEALLELVDAAGGVDEAALAGVVRVAGRADFQGDDRILDAVARFLGAVELGAAAEPLFAVAGVAVQDGAVGGVNVLLHDASILLKTALLAAICRARSRAAA